ncbi:DUF6042 family protein [Kitasatospora arboriphila]
MSAQPEHLPAPPPAPALPPAPAPRAAARLLARIRAQEDTDRRSRWLPAFERDWAKALDDSRQTYDLTPLHDVVRTWQVRLDSAPAVDAFTAAAATTRTAPTWTSSSEPVRERPHLARPPLTQGRQNVHRTTPAHPAVGPRPPRHRRPHPLGLATVGRHRPRRRRRTLRLHRPTQPHLPRQQHGLAASTSSTSSGSADPRPPAPGSPAPVPRRPHSHSHRPRGPRLRVAYGLAAALGHPDPAAIPALPDPPAEIRGDLSGDLSAVAVDAAANARTASHIRGEAGRCRRTRPRRPREDRHRAAPNLEKRSAPRVGPRPRTPADPVATRDRLGRHPSPATGRRHPPLAVAAGERRPPPPVAVPGRATARSRRPARLCPTFRAPPCPAPGRWPGDPYDIADPQEIPVPNTAAEHRRRAAPDRAAPDRAAPDRPGPRRPPERPRPRRLDAHAAARHLRRPDVRRIRRYPSHPRGTRRRDRHRWPGRFLLGPPRPGRPDREEAEAALARARAAAARYAAHYGLATPETVDDLVTLLVAAGVLLETPGPAGTVLSPVRPVPRPGDVFPLDDTEWQALADLERRHTPGRGTAAVIGLFTPRGVRLTEITTSQGRLARAIGQDTEHARQCVL